VRRGGSWSLPGTMALLRRNAGRAWFGPAIPIAVRETRHVVQTTRHQASAAATSAVPESHGPAGSAPRTLSGAEPGPQQIVERTEWTWRLSWWCGRLGFVISFIPVLMTGATVSARCDGPRAPWTGDGRPSPREPGHDPSSSSLRR
jgi:hypothetical protein